MAVSREELNRRKDLIKQMMYMCEKDVEPFNQEAFDLWENSVQNCTDENDIALLAADDDRFITLLRVFACVIQMNCYDDEVLDVTPINEEEL
jgi:hypothetical protein